MPAVNPHHSILLLVDFQVRLLPAIAGGAEVIGAAGRLLGAARILGVPRLFTEQYPKGLGSTVPDLPVEADPVISKLRFSAWDEPGFQDHVPADAQVVVGGCEAHVCVLQTVLDLRAAGRRVFVVRDAVGSRRPESLEAGLARMERHGAEVVTTEMVIFEWLRSAANPKFREVIALIK